MGVDRKTVLWACLSVRKTKLKRKKRLKALISNRTVVLVLTAQWQKPLKLQNWRRIIYCTVAVNLKEVMMTKSELIERLTLKHELPPKQVEASVKRYSNRWCNPYRKVSALKFGALEASLCIIGLLVLAVILKQVILLNWMENMYRILKRAKSFARGSIH